MIKPIALTCLLATVPLSAMAATVPPTGFALAAAYDWESASLADIEGGSTTGFCTVFAPERCDGVLDFAGTLIGVDFVSPSAFDISLGGEALSKLTVTLTDLVFGAPLRTVAFDIDGSDPQNPDNLSGYVESEDNPTAPPPPGVAVAFDAGSITIDLTDISPGLFGDGPALRFDLAYADGPTPPAVPLPATGLLLVAGLGGLAALRRRR